jgi:4-hydroxy 2-oxovalerate aldolase
MMPKSNQTKYLLDCTLRDGGYYNRWDFSTDLVNRYLVVMADSGIEWVELGFRFLQSRDYMGPCAFTTDAWIESLDIPAALRIGVMVNASELIACDRGFKWAVNQLFLPREHCRIEQVRIASNFTELDQALEVASVLSGLGYRTAVNLMQVASLKDSDLSQSASKVQASPPDIFYLADSTGGLTPDSTRRKIEAVRQSWDGPMGIHAHDNMEMALANTLAAADSGVDWLDCTVMGMGRGPGNCKTESLLTHSLDGKSDLQGIEPILELIDTEWKPLKEQYQWGTNPYYLVAGRHDIHPTYVQEMLDDSRYSKRDILAVLTNLVEADGRQFRRERLDIASQFYQGKGKGEWSPRKSFEGREVLVLATGPGTARHHIAIEQFIEREKPLVIALNAETPIRDELIDYRAACHPVRLMADCRRDTYAAHPLIAPLSMLPDPITQELHAYDVRDFGIQILTERFEFNDTHTGLPTPMVIAYVLGLAASGGAAKLMFTGLDGYPGSDRRNEQMNWLLECYRSTPGSVPVKSLTPSRYRLEKASIYCVTRG